MAKRTPKTVKKKNAARRHAPGLVTVLAAVAAIMTAAFLLLTGPAEPAEPRPTLSPSIYTARDFAVSDGYFRCTVPGARLGVDVSEHQEEIDWQQVKDAGFDFAFIRVGYRGFSEGGIHEDLTAAENLAAAREAGLDVGVYFYSQAVSIEEAAEEALFCVRFLQGQQLELPIVFDWEYISQEARTGAVTGETLTRCAQVFCETVEKSGYEAMVYFNPNLSRTLLDLTELQDYPFWLALYTEETDYPYAVEFWQYTETGAVPGIERDVDINIQFP